MHTPDTVNPVSAACERYQIPCISVDAPLDAWLTGGPYKWSYHASFSVNGLDTAYFDEWDSVQTNKIVGGLFSNDPDGVTISADVAKKAQQRGYKYVDTGKFPYGTKDFSAAINKFKAENVEIVVTNMIPPDTATAWRQMYSQGWVPKMISMGKAALFPTDMEALGQNLANGVSTECWWHPSFPYKSSLTGETAQQLADAWTKDTKKQWSGPVAVNSVGWELVADVLKRAGSLDKTKLRDTIAATNIDTVMGHIQYKADHTAELPITAGQWQKGKDYAWELQIVNAKQYPEIKTTATVLFPIPH
jgi:branched-chain amino acid transport system substrate-binding protein